MDALKLTRLSGAGTIKPGARRYVLRVILDDRIEALLPVHALVVSKMAEENEYKGLLTLARRYLT